MLTTSSDVLTGRRSRAFSQLMGLLFVGMSVGPLLSGYIMRVTGELLPVFYTTAAIDTTVSLTVWLIMPESISPAEMQKHRAARAQKMQAMGTGVLGWLRRVGSSLDIVSPMSVLLPTRVEKVGRKRSLDWTIPTLAAAYGFGTFIQVIHPLPLLLNGMSSSHICSVYRQRFTSKFSTRPKCLDGHLKLYVPPGSATCAYADGAVECR